MAMRSQLYKIVVYEVDAEIDADGVTVTETPTISYSTEAVTPWDSVMAWSARLEEEEAS
jgi:hypothetical protein